METRKTVGGVFNSKFVYYTWDDRLNNKKVYVANYIGQLEKDVEFGLTVPQKIYYSDDKDFPFQTEPGKAFVFCYFDPNIEFKKAYLKGKKVYYYNHEWPKPSALPEVEPNTPLSFFDDDTKTFTLSFETDELKSKFRQLLFSDKQKRTFYFQGLSELIPVAVTFWKDDFLFIGKYGKNEYNLVGNIIVKETLDINNFNMYKAPTSIDFGDIFDYFLEITEIPYIMEKQKSTLRFEEFSKNQFILFDQRRDMYGDEADEDHC